MLQPFFRLKYFSMIKYIILYKLIYRIVDRHNNDIHVKLLLSVYAAAALNVKMFTFLEKL